MVLNESQKEKMKNKLINFAEELGGIIKDKGVELSIELESNYNNYGGLVFKIHTNHFGYETNKTRFIMIYDADDDKRRDSVYSKWKYENDYICYFADCMLDILMNKDKILKMAQEKAKYNEILLNRILGDD